ncbi:MAG: protoporphyrinogen oxidase [Sulfitobacter sp.]|nr:protoporphyrinogen oxidase [Sulfitobacter sp.]
MKVLILYGTVEGHTGKIANFVTDQVREAGHEVALVDTDDVAQISFEGVDAVILAASVHQRRHPKNFEASVSAHREDLRARKTLMLSVSLNAAFPEGLEEAGEYLTEMKMRTNFTPDHEMLVAGAVRTGHYDYFAMQVVRHVVLRGRDVDPEAGEHEFTDWDAVGAQVGAFLETTG